MNHKVIAAAFSLATLVSTPAFSAPAPYVSLAIGGSNADIDCSGTDSCNNTATAVKVIGGYDFGNQFAIEGMYVSLGEPTSSMGSLDMGVQSSYWGLGGAFRPAFNKEWSGVLRLGVAFTTSKVKLSAPGGSGSQSYDSTNAYLGAGIAYAIDKNLKLEGDIDTTQISVLDGSDKQTARVVDYTVGITYSF
jgi:hypothetical protein